MWRNVIYPMITNILVVRNNYIHFGFAYVVGHTEIWAARLVEQTIAIVVTFGVFVFGRLEALKIKRWTIFNYWIGIVRVYSSQTDFMKKFRMLAALMTHSTIKIVVTEIIEIVRQQLDVRFRAYLPINLFQSGVWFVADDPFDRFFGTFLCN